MTVAAVAAAAPAHTDWLYHHLIVTGPAAALAAFRDVASGAGVIPWVLDFDRVEEDAFLRLAASPQRTLSMEGARLLAGELRGAVARRHALAVERVGRSRACPFDLHALLPVPGAVLRLGPDDPEALAWLWEHWGTTAVLRHVALLPPGRAGETAFGVSFWSANWTPWRAVTSARDAWPGLLFDVRPVYDLA